MASNPQFKLKFLGFERVPSHKAIKIQHILLAAGKQILSEEKLMMKRVSGPLLLVMFQMKIEMSMHVQQVAGFFSSFEIVYFQNLFFDLFFFFRRLYID